MTDAERTAAALAERFAADIEVPDQTAGTATLRTMAARGSCRAFTDRPVSRDLLRLIAAVALSSPTKSDLQQRDIVLVTDPSVRAGFNAIVGADWMDKAPAFAVICGNNRRHRQIHEWHGIPFTNDHLDAFFNAAVDAGIALEAMVCAAEAVGLGTCPISAIRNACDEVSRLLALPDHVFPIAGLALGWPARDPAVAMRLPLHATVHENRFDDTTVRDDVAGYDAARSAHRPFARQRNPERFGTVENYGWSHDKARQYADPQRADFGAHIRAKGFKLD